MFALAQNHDSQIMSRPPPLWLHIRPAALVHTHAADSVTRSLSSSMRRPGFQFKLLARVPIRRAAESRRPPPLPALQRQHQLQ